MGTNQVNSKILISCSLFVVALTAGARLTVQDASGPADPMRARWAEYARPSAAHKELQPGVGKWSLKVRHFVSAHEPMMESEATSQVEWIMDGRYTLETVSGLFMGMPFRSIGITGYDNLKKKYVSSSIDNMGTGIMASEGTYDTATRTFTYTSEYPDPMSGKYVKGRMTQKWKDNDHWIMQQFHPGADGKSVMGMEVEGIRMK